MDVRSIWRKIAYGAIASLLFALLFLATFQDRRENVGTRQAEIVVLGDSIFGLIRDETSIPARLQALTGKTVYNAALGGTSAARRSSDSRMNCPKDSFTLAGLAKAIQAEDFGVQHSITIRESNTECYPEVIDGLETVDFSRVETVIILQGINDYHAGIPIENPEDPYDEYTFLGALRSSLDALKKTNPGLRVMWLTPTYTWYIAAGETCEEADQGGGKLSDYVEAQLRTAQEMGVEIIDVYHDFYPHDNWEDWELYTFDGIHPNEEGRELLAQRIVAALEGRAW